MRASLMDVAVRTGVDEWGLAWGSMWMGFSVGAMVFAGLIVIDTWRLIEYADLLLDDYVLCVLDLELDIFNLFLFVLRLMGRGGAD